MSVLNTGVVKAGTNYVPMTEKFASHSLLIYT